MGSHVFAVFYVTNLRKIKIFISFVRKIGYCINFVVNLNT